MHNRITLMLNLFIGFFTSVSSSHAEQAMVRSYSEQAQPVGQAYLTHYGDQCLALLPTHVVEESKTPTFLREGNALLGESVSTVDLGDDLSLAKVSGSISKDCGYSMSTVSRAVGSLIKGQGIATLRSVIDDGSIARLAVAITDDDGHLLLRVRPTNDKAQIRKGQSGSLLMINDQPVGMLLSIEEKRGVQFGVVLRMDALLAKADRYMADHRAEQRLSPLDQHTTAKAGEGDVIGWSALPIDAEHRASNLTADENALSWRARVEQWPVEIELDVAGEKVAISKIELDGRDILAEELPQQIEILINVSQGKKRWRSLLSRKVSFNDGIATISFASTWARQVKIVIRSNYGADKVISLKRIRILGS